MKTRFYFLLSLFLILGFLTLDYFLNSKIIQLKSSKQERTASVVSMASKPVIGSKVQAAADTENNTETDSDSVIQFKAEFQNEVLQIGQIQANPEAIENRLQALARQMQPEHRDYLKSVLINKSNAGDDRALAIELLSRSQTPEAAEILKNYTITEINDVGVDKNQELVFKAQAIEGLAGFQDQNIALSYLNEISQKTDYSFLQDRTRRAQAAIKNEAPAVEKQDLDALKKIVE